ncbi:hypothetical protein [uncultured Methanobrevibacter sp.]|nr:hypothetical protein [uncultured Methanobrevibacter sp.]
MENHDDSLKPTVVLNKSNSDGFLDFNTTSDLKQVIRALNKLIQSR